MLEELFKHNKLEYVDIETRKGKNIILDITLNNNIENLKCFGINSYNIRYEVILDIS